jgi:low affinity Fe/Cu permease
VLTATWALVGVTAVLALTSLVAVITWRENRRREREDQVAAKILEAARKEFSAKNEVVDLKDKLSGYGVLLAVAAVVAWLVKKDNEKRD